MKTRYSLAFFCLAFITVNAQGPNPPEIDAQEQVKQVIETFFDGFHKQDSSIIKNTLIDKVVLQTTGRDLEGKTRFREENLSEVLASICSIPDSIKFEERLTSFSIQVDRTMANAWVGYEFWLNDEFSHCGINSFQLVDFDGEWKIIYLIDTRGKAGCLED